MAVTITTNDIKIHGFWTIGDGSSVIVTLLGEEVVALVGVVDAVPMASAEGAVSVESGAATAWTD